MKKIVVATDFSANSKKGILFAIQLAKQTDCELIFYNVLQIYQPTIWDTTYYNVYEATEIKQSQEFLENYINGIFLDSTDVNPNYTCICEIGLSASNEIIAFANKHGADFICVGNLGNGKLIQMLGTVASELIAFSTIPVIIVPINYSVKLVENVFFASDFVNFEVEFHQIQLFSTAINANLNIYHFDYQTVLDADENKFDNINTHYQSDKVHFHLRNLDAGKLLLQEVEKEIDRNDPSLVVVFTEQNRNWFDKLFLSSLSTDLAFDTKIPMLVFKKRTK
jgi:nucleotide-binding universal stress UspA family protein